MKQYCTEAGSQWDCWPKQKTLSQCQSCNTGISGHTRTVHGMIGLANSCHIASLYSVSQIWQVKLPVVPIKYIPQICYKFPPKQINALIWYFHHHSFKNLSLFLTRLTQVTRRKNLHSKAGRSSPGSQFRAKYW